MARPLRIERAGAWYHITARGIERREIFTNDKERRHWLELMPDFSHAFRIRVHGYVLMDNHFHMILETQEANLARAMQWLQTSYSMWFNRKRDRVGPLFQGRYKAIVVEPLGWGLELSRYVHLNPVRIQSMGLDKSARSADRLGVGGKPDAARINERVQALRDYRWSSYRAYAGLENPPAWLEVAATLRLGGKGSLKALRERYRAHVEAGVRQGLPESPWEHLIGRVVLGKQEFVDEIKKRLQGRKNARENAEAGAFEARPAWASVIAAVESVRGMKWNEIRERRGDWGRDLAWYLGRRECGMFLTEIGEHSDGSDYATISAAVKRMERRLAREPLMARRLADIEDRMTVC